MITIKGKYNESKVFASVIDNATKGQIETLLNQKFVKDLKIAIMPDCHAGAGCVIGTTMTIKDKIVPNLVGVDIGCGMLCVSLGKIQPCFENLDKFIKENIPFGLNVNESKSNFIPVINNDKNPAQPEIAKFNLEALRCFKELKNLGHLEKSMGTLGGGNHFIEVDKSITGNYYLVIHTGSRNLGKQVAEIYQKKAIESAKAKLFNKKKAIENIIETYKVTGRQKEIPLAIQGVKDMLVNLEMPESLCYVEGQDFKDYIHDMEICQDFAKFNRRTIAQKIIDFLDLEVNNRDYFETIHNYIDTAHMILRKGAISACNGELVLIPINMRDGSIVAKGKGNPDYNFSGPHGAGRTMSRSQARKEVKLEDFEKTMEGIYSSTITQDTIDESPFAYKSLEDILPNIKDTVDIIEIIKPVYNFKASE